MSLSQLSGLPNTTASSLRFPAAAASSRIGSTSLMQTFRPAYDSVRFSGLQSKPSFGSTLSEHAENLSSARLHAQKAGKKRPTRSGKHYGTLIVFEDGRKALGTNIESGTHAARCDLSVALDQAINQDIAENPDTPSPKIKTIYFTNADPKGEPAIPCVDCLERLDTEDGIGPESRVIIEKTFDGAVKDLLPLHKGRPTPPRMNTETLWHPRAARPTYSLAAQSVLTQKFKDSRKQRARFENQLLNLVSKAQSAYEKNIPTESKRPQTTACALVSPGSLTLSGTRLYWNSTRWFEEADRQTVALLLQTTEALQQRLRQVTKYLPGFSARHLQKVLKTPAIQAIGYYGNDPSSPSIASLGRFARKEGSPDILIATIEDDQLQIRTIGDYLPFLYKLGRKP